ncbi:MAG TPA: thermonuclease family protein [Planctomycetota bacterium]|nr:thermonuclease family protein [Planctomycetota bacterium]
MPRRRRMKVGGPVGLLVALLAAAVAYWAARQPPQGVPTEAVIAGIADGDTVHIRANGVKHTLRLIGVDTPEVHESDKLERDVQRTGQDKRTIQALGKRASDFTRRLCEGKTCRLEYDPANTSGGHRDKYGRLLVYLFVPDASGREVLVNAEILRNGYGAAMTAYPFDDGRKAEFRRLEREARGARKGLWAEWKTPRGE